MIFCHKSYRSPKIGKLHYSKKIKKIIRTYITVVLYHYDKDIMLRIQLHEKYHFIITYERTESLRFRYFKQNCQNLHFKTQ